MLSKNYQNYAFLLISLFLTSTTLFAQQIEDVVYLKNGGILRGRIIEQIPGQSLKIETIGRNVFVLKADEIEKTSKEPVGGSNNYNSKGFKKKGSITIIELTSSYGVGKVKVDDIEANNKDYSFGAKLFNGYQFNDYFALGISLGVDKYKDVTLLPLALSSRFCFINGRVSPTLNLDAGYSFGTDKTKGGLLINPSLGIRTFVSSKTALLLNIGYKLQASEVTYYTFYSGGGYYNNYYRVPTTKLANFHFVSASIGLSF